MSKANDAHLTSLMCIARSSFSDLIKKIEEMGYEVIITNSFRSRKKQMELQKKLKDRPGVKAAKKSKHEYGVALDINLKKGDKWWKLSTPKDEWEKTNVPKIARENGFRWGGDFRDNYDPVHFDLGRNVSMKNLAADIEKLSDKTRQSALYCKVESFFVQYMKKMD